MKLRLKKSPQQQTVSRVITAPVARTQVSRTPAPKINRSFSNGDVEVEHTEFLADIRGSTAFQVNAIPVNPGLASSFPWLSRMASMYESYQIKALRYEYRTETSTNAVGSVMGAVDYDASDPPPLYKEQLANYRGYQRSAPWNNFTQKSLPEDLNKRKSYYVRSGALSANQDIKLYDVGNFFLATGLQADNSVIGELYVHYKIKLMTPQLTNPAVGNALSGRWTFSTTAAATANGSDAPLTASGTCLSATPAVITAIAPYDCLVTWVGRGNGPFTLVTTGSTCTIDTPQYASTTGAASLSIYTAQLSFRPGQTFVTTPSVDCTTAGITVGQFNSSVL